MNQQSNRKKSARNALSSSDWHRADIVAALHKAGWTLRQLSREHGYQSANTLCNALDRPWQKGEEIIADAIGVPACVIWPTRYQRRSQSPFSRLARAA